MKRLGWLNTVLAVAMMLNMGAAVLYALPTGESVEKGNASFERPNESTLNITAGDGAVINFNGFSIGPSETVNFNPKDPALAASTNVLTRVTGPEPSYIAGTLNADLNLYFVNQSGIYFTPSARINANNFVASTMNIATNNFIQGNYRFEQNMENPKYSRLMNEGRITAENNAALIGSAVSNTGTGIVIARAGTVSLASGDKVTVSFDVRGIINVEVNEKTTGKVLDLQGNAVKDAVANAGRIEAKQVMMTAKTAGDIFENAVNQTGVVKATGFTVNEKGAIRVISDSKVQVSGELSSSSLRGGAVEIAAPLKTAGDTEIKADRDIMVKADITTDSGNLDLIADADMDGAGAFRQAKDTTISTLISGDITIQSSGAGTLANIISAGDLVFRKGGAPAVFTQWADSGISAGGSMRIGEDVTIKAGNTVYEIGKDWRNYGNFIPEMSTVRLVSDRESLVLGSNTFNNFTIIAPGKIVRFDGGQTQVVLGVLTLKGAYGKLLVVGSIEPPKQWKILPQGDTDISYVLAGDCINIRGPPLKGLHSDSSGNITNWDLDPYWTGQGPTANWSDPDNWDTGTVPLLAAIVTFDGTTGLNPNKDSVVDASFQGTIAKLTIDGYTGNITLHRGLTITGDFTMASGTLAAGSQTLTVGGNWTRTGGDFRAGASTVVFNDASKTSYITGNNTFYNLTCLTPGKTLVFEANTLTTVQNVLTIEGIGDNHITLCSSIYAPGSEFGIYINAVSDLEGNPYVQYVNVYYSHAYGPVIPVLAKNYYIPSELNIDWDDTHTWTGTTSVDWATGSNWGGTAPENGDDVVLTGAGSYRPTNQNIGSLSLVSLTFDATTTVGFTVSGSAFTLTSSGTALSVASGAAAHTISCDITLGASQTWSQASANTFTVSGVVSDSTNTYGITKTGTGTLVLSGNNSYDGATNVNVGTLNIRHNNALGSATGGTTVATGAQLELQGGITVTGEALTLSGGDMVTATGGDSVTTYGAYEVRSFTTVGNANLTVTAGSVDYLVVGGGGGAGSRIGGGGGAGGLLTGSTTVIATDYPIVVGDGGTGNKTGSSEGNGNPGQNSSFNSLTAVGGGYGGTANSGSVNAGDGGSGGGGGSLNKTSNVGGSGTSGQGYNGGTGKGSTYAGGGGGGAGGAGTNYVDSGSHDKGGAGGAGTSSSITGVATWYAGGGGGGSWDNTGGAGGSGVGGTGATISGTPTNGGNGATNTGSGGGGGYQGGNGGSGIVIVRYLSSGALENVSGDNIWTGAITLASNNAITTTGGSLNVSGANDGSYALTKTGTGTLTLSASNTYTGGTTIQNGTLRLGVANAIPAASITSVTATGAGVTATLDLNGYDLTLTNALTLGGTTTTSTANVSTGAGTLTVNGGITYSATNNPLGSTVSGKVSLGGTTRTFTVGDSSSTTNELTISAVISGTGSEGITKAGAGTLTLSNANTYSGGTTISAGTLAPTNANALGTGFMTLDASGTLNASGAANLNISGNWTNNGGTFTPDSGTVTFNGASANIDAGGIGSGKQFYKVIVDTTGTKTLTSAILINDDLVVTAGTLAGKYNVTVKGGDVTGASTGVISLTEGTFTLEGTGSFGGVTGSDWTFYDLTFGDGTNVRTTTKSGDNAINVNDILTVKTNHTLAPGSSYWNIAWKDYIKSVTMIASGYHHTLALTSDGYVWAWGSNSDGQLGDGTTTDRLWPVEVLKGEQSGTTYLSGISKIAAGGNHSLALKSDGTEVYAWGYNEYGQLGDDTTTQRLTPVQVHGGAQGGGLLTGISSIAAGGDMSAAVTPVSPNGYVYTWGYGEEGQLGNNGTASSSTPVQVVIGEQVESGSYLRDITQVAVGAYHMAALDHDGYVYSWGYNGLGELGDGTTTDSKVPVRVHGGEQGGDFLSGISAISTGDAHTIALVSSGGYVYSWGSNTYGQLGDGTTTQSQTPVQVHGVGGTGVISGVSQISAGSCHNIVLASNGAIYAWGENQYGQLGDSSTTNRLYPVMTHAAGSGITSISAGAAQTMLLTQVQYILSAGWNATGQLGIGTTVNTSIGINVIAGAQSGSDPAVAFTPVVVESSATLSPGTATFKYYQDYYHQIINIASQGASNTVSYYSLTIDNPYATNINFQNRLITGTLTAGSGVKKLSFSAASELAPHTVSTLFNVSGSSGSLIELAPINSETTWYLDAPTSTTVSYLRVGYSHQADDKPITATNSETSGTNTNWNIT